MKISLKFFLELLAFLSLQSALLAAEGPSCDSEANDWVLLEVPQKVLQKEITEHHDREEGPLDSDFLRLAVQNKNQTFVEACLKKDFYKQLHDDVLKELEKNTFEWAKDLALIFSKEIEDRFERRRAKRLRKKKAEDLERAALRERGSLKLMRGLFSFSL